MKTLAFVMCSVLLLSAFMCNTPIEKQAYRTVVASKSFLDSVKSKHSECGLVGVETHQPLTQTDVCKNLTKAISAKDLLIDAVEVYCAGPVFNSGGTCNPPTQQDARSVALAKLQGAIAQYNLAETDLKGVLK